MQTFKRNVLAVAIASACLGFCAVASAAPAPAAPGAPQNAQDQAQTGATTTTAAEREKEQQEKAKKLGAVKITGYISSIQNAVAIQRYSDNIVEAVSSEQIGKLPGVSIADALGRLPGLAVQTLDGRPQVVTIHGFGPDFSTALVNGREQVSTGNSRGVQFDQYPSSWFNNVVVHLTPNADLIGQGLAGTVDMRTIRPLEVPHPIAAVNYRYNWDQYSELAPGGNDTGYDVNGVYVNQFADHTFGITLGVDLQSTPTQIQHQAPWGYPNTSTGALVIGGSKNYGISDNLNRSAFLGTLEYKPSDNFTSTLDMTYDNFREAQQAKGIEFPLFWSGAQLQPGYTTSNGFVSSGTYANVKGVIRNDFNWTHAKVYNIGWNNKIRFNEDWSAESDLSYSRANRHDILVESYSGTGYTPANGATDTIGFNELGSGMLYLNPALNYAGSNIVLTDPQGWGAGANPSIVQAGFNNAPSTEDYLANLRLSVKRNFSDGPFSSLVFGVDRATRNKTYNIVQDFLTLPNGSQTFATTPIGAQTAPIPTGALLNGGSCDPLAFMGVGPEVCYNPLYLLNNYYTVFPTSLSSIAVPPNWKVRENDVKPFFQFNIDTHVGGVSLRGNVGLQMVHTNQMSAGSRVTAGNAGSGSQPVMIPVNGSTKYNRYLPSINLVFGLSPSTDIRLSAARVLARARMDQMNASLGVSGNITHLASTDPNTSYFSASGGNPKLLPTMANNFNASIEHYFADNKGYLQLSAYFIQLHDYINPNAAFLYNFAAFVPDYLTPAQQTQLGTTYGIVSGPTNDGHGYVKGVQGVASVPLDLLTPMLSGFGFTVSADYTNSSLVYGSNPTPITVPGLSKWAVNNTLYFERDGFDARVSQSYRSSFLGEVGGISATRILQTIQGGDTYDAQVSYTFGSGRFKNLSLILQGSNLTNKTFKTYQNGDPRQVLIWESYGRTYSIGASYKFF
ncbi:MAG: TonB-dependent receptor [Xanthomonadaceae bacterium]|nr:TonB-dependent receptor [Xanthomonadaceae bacterium]